MTLWYQAAREGGKALQRDDQALLLVEEDRVDIELADIQCLGLEVWSVAGVFLRCQGHQARKRNGHKPYHYGAEGTSFHDVSMPAILHVDVRTTY